jgi:hypothetical protein
MGDGEYVGNASVYWSVDYGDGQKLVVKQADPQRPKAGDTHSVATDVKVQGRDPKSVQFFDVTLRFESQADARRQLQAALAAVDASQGGTSFFLTFRVPATVNGVVRPTPDTEPRPDIGIHW